MYISRKAFLFTLAVIIIGIGVLIGVSNSRVFPRWESASIGRGSVGVATIQPTLGGAVFEGKTMMADDVASSYMPPPSIPQPESVRGGELYLQDTALSLVSSDPVSAEAKIREITTDLGGFLVSSQLSRPEEGASAQVIVRVPTDRLDEAFQRFEATGERVISRSVQGRDVTEQYQDLAARLETLNTVESRLQTLLEQTEDATVLLRIQQQLFQIQDQKDAIEGQRQYLEDSAALTRVTIYLASDEQALPYVPAEPWKPEAIFKQAVRSLVGTLRGAGSAVIWLAVYLPLAIPVAVIAWLLNRRLQR